MKEDGIEDIAIDYSQNYSNKKGKKIFLLIFLILVIILGASYFLYNKYYKKTVTSKQLFFQGLSGLKLENILDVDIYENIYNRLLKENATIDNNITFLSSNEQKNFEGYDIRKFSLNFNTNTNVEKNKFFSVLDVNYSDNDLIKFNLLGNSDKTAIYSDKIVKKYVGVNNDNLKEFFGIDYNKNLLNDLKNNKINITDDEKKNYITKYIETISNAIPEEKFSVVDNYALEKNGQTVNVITYTVKLSQEDLIDVMKIVLKELRDDKDLLNNLITNNSNYDIKINVRDNNIENSADSADINENIEENGELQENNLMDASSIIETILPEGAEINFEGPFSNQTDSENSNLENNSLDNIKLDIDLENINDYINIIRLLAGNKIDYSLNNVENSLDTIIEKIDNLEGNGLTVNVYVSTNGTEKISAILPNNSSLDIEFNKQTEEETDIALIYLNSAEKSSFNFSDDNVKVLSTSDEIQNEKTGRK